MNSLRNEILACLLLIALTCAAYAGLLKCGFVNFDDDIYVTANSSVQRGLSGAGFKYAWTTFDSGNYLPLTWLSLEIDASLFGMNPAGFHATNLLLHLAAAVLLLIVLRRMTSQLWPSAAVALLFALHPLHVESVAWISERKDVLSTFFLMLTLFAYERYAATPSKWRYAVVLAAMVLGLLSKSMLVSLPFLLLLLDVWPLQRIEWRKLPAASATIASPPDAGFVQRYSRCTYAAALREKLPLFALALLWCVVTLVAQQSADSYKPLGNLPLSFRAGNAISAYAWYLEKTFWPTGLAAFYPHPQETLSLLAVGGSLVVLACISLFVLWSAPRRPAIAVGWLWFLIALVPVIGIVQVGSQAYADRYVYVPHIGLFLMVVFGTFDFAMQKSFGRPVWMIFLALLLAGCFVATHSQVAVWHGSETLWQHALAIDPDNYVAYYKLGDLRMAEGNFEESAEYFAKVSRLKPKVAGAHNNRGIALQQLRRFPEAEREYAAALQINPGHPQALGNLAALVKKRGDFKSARKLYAKVVEIDPKNPSARNQFGLVLGRLGELDEAAKQFEAALIYDSQSADAANNLGMALMQFNRDEEAEKHLRHALKIAPDFASAHFNLGELLERERDLAGAKEHFAAALKLNPNDAEARERLQFLQRASDRSR